MKLRFYARGDGLVSVPQERRTVGVPARYVGRKPVKGAAGLSYPATEEAYEVEAGSDAAKRLVKQCSRGELWAADAQTAEACSVAFVPVKLENGEWSPKPKEMRPPK